MNSTLIFALVSAFVSIGVAAAVAWQERRSIAYWAFAVGMLALAAESIFFGLSVNASPDELLKWQAWRLAASSFLPGIWLLFSLSYARGNYRSFLDRSKYLLASALIVPIGIAFLFQSELLVPVKAADSTEAAILGLGIPGFVLNLFLLVGFILVLMNLERTFRASVGTMRWRIKFMILGLGILFAVRTYTSSQILLFRSENPALQAVEAAALLVACLLIIRSLFRTGHFEVHVYPSQSVLSNSLTVLLAGIYLLIVGVFAKAVSFFGGDASFALKAFLVLVCLVIFTVLLLSDRVRLAIKQFVSRHFQRPLYDYRTVWRNFTEGTVSCVEQGELCRAIVKLVANIFQVLSVTIWLVDDKKSKLIFASSTSLSESKGNALTPQSADAVEVIQALELYPEPIDIDASTENWASALRRSHPDEFRKGGSRVCVPIIMGGEVLGLMTLGDRVSGVQFSQQDFDLLKCIGDQVAAELSNVQLSQKLLQARELEAFQTMSAFFVHDLKNTASTLSLMLQNLPIHYHDPAFKEDALRGISKSVKHINDLIQRLTLFRHENAMTLVDGDLNKLVENILSELPKMPDINLVKELRPLPKHRLDPEQMHKVITNLLLNAKDATNSAGEIRVETSQENNRIVLSVSDTGCGMTNEFLETSLFRPFQTTKKNGIGIGMFQSKMIVEAHGGKIAVETSLGKGTVFRVLLPVVLQK